MRLVRASRKFWLANHFLQELRQEIDRMAEGTIRKLQLVKALDLFRAMAATCSFTCPARLMCSSRAERRTESREHEWLMPERPSKENVRVVRDT